MVAMNAPKPAVIRSLFLLKPWLSVLRVLSYKEMCLRINENGRGNKAGRAADSISQPQLRSDELK
jgi:hypothetical protein